MTCILSCYQSDTIYLHICDGQGIKDMTSLLVKDLYLFIKKITTGRCSQIYLLIFLHPYLSVVPTNKFLNNLQRQIHVPRTTVVAHLAIYVQIEREHWSYVQIAGCQPTRLFQTRYARF